MMINLGAIGKGDALDRLARELTAAGVTDFLIHGGQSSVIARGDQVPGSDLGWAIGIAHPTKPQRRLAGVWLKDQAIGTSGSGKQFFHHRGRRYGHVIDPRTGQPAGDLLSLTVIMTSAADADACATGLFVAGSESATRLRETAESSVEESISMLAARAGRRQDDVELEPQGEFRWVDESTAGSLWTPAEDEH
jgi:thiamine biosynthesis lipoprotein